MSRWFSRNGMPRGHDASHPTWFSFGTENTASPVAVEHAFSLDLNDAPAMPATDRSTDSAAESTADLVSGAELEPAPFGPTTTFGSPPSTSALSQWLEGHVGPESSDPADVTVPTLPTKSRHAPMDPNPVASSLHRDGVFGVTTDTVAFASPHLAAATANAGDPSRVVAAPPRRKPRAARSLRRVRVAGYHLRRRVGRRLLRVALTLVATCARFAVRGLRGTVALLRSPTGRYLVQHFGDIGSVIFTLGVGIFAGVMYARSRPAVQSDPPSLAAARPRLDTSTRASVSPHTPIGSVPSASAARPTDSRLSGDGSPAGSTVPSPSDWADSLSLPAHVSAGARPDMVSRSYAPLGQAARRVEPPPATLTRGLYPNRVIRPGGQSWDPRSSATAAIPRQSSVPSRTVPSTSSVSAGGGATRPSFGETTRTEVTASPASSPSVSLVLGARTNTDRITLLPLTSSGVPRGGRVDGDALARAGQCRNTLTVAADRQSAHENSVVSAWSYALLVPGATCGQTASRAFVSRSPTTQERLALAAASRSGVVMQGLGVSAFSSADLREIAVGDVGGTRYAWGVFRTVLSSTQMAPQPPVAQLAFVARQTAAGWEMEWGKYSERASDHFALAGVLDLTQHGRYAAFFVSRDSDGTSRLLTVAPEGGWWKLVNTAGF